MYITWKFKHLNQLYLISLWELKELNKFVFFNTELECETMKQENTRLQNIVDNQKYSVADIERINHERNELQQQKI